LLQLTDYDFQLSFYPTNPFNKIRIVTRFLKITQCVIQNGLKVLDINTAFVCNFYSNIAEISNFQTYYISGRSSVDLVVIKLRATTINLFGTLPPIEVYTCNDMNCFFKVDESTNSPDTIISAGNSPAKQTATNLQLSSLDPNTLVTLSGFITPLQNYTETDSVTLRFVFPQQFQLGNSMTEGPACTYKSYYQYENGPQVLSSISEGSLDCGISSTSQFVIEAKLKYLIKKYPLLMKNPTKAYLDLYNSLSITNILTPRISAIYNIDMFVVLDTSSGPVLKESYRLTVTINPVSFSFTPTVTSVNSNSIALLTIDFTTPFALMDSNQAADNYFSKFSQIRVRFPQIIGVNPVWSWNLGYQTNNGLADIDCWAFRYLKAYSSSIKCTLVAGKDPSSIVTNNDFVTLIIQNYKKLQPGDIVSFCLFVKYPSSTVQPSISLDLYELNQGDKQIIATAKVILTLPVALPPIVPTFNFFSVVSSSMQAMTSTNVTIKFTTTSSFLMSDKVNLQIYLPSGWNFITTIGQSTKVFLNGQQVFSPVMIFTKQKYMLFINVATDFTIGAQEVIIQNILIQYGAAVTNTFLVELFANNLKKFSQSQSAGTVPCTNSAGLAVWSNLSRPSMAGSAYFFSWNSSSLYNNSRIEIKLPSDLYSLTDSENHFDFRVDKQLVDSSLVSFTATGSTLIFTLSSVSL
jgi:hypothetical protein